MKVRRKVLLYLLGPIVIASLATDALASCPGFDQGPPCQEYWRSDAVFIGLVTRVVRTPNYESPDFFGPYATSTVYITVQEAFKGVEEPSVVLELDHCGFFFNEGERYLVYARRNHNKLDVRHRNTRTRLLSEAAEDLEYIRGLSSAEPGARVFGQVTQLTRIIKKETSHLSEPLPNIKVFIVGKDERREVVTDSEGRYEFKRLKAGTYRVQAEVPAYLKHEERPLRVKGPECVPVNISAMRTAEIAGRVLDPDGKPVANVPITLVSADASLEDILAEVVNGKNIWSLSYTSEQGRYSFSHLPPGRYFLLINRGEFERSRGTENTRALPRLFYPGVSDLGGAKVILINKDQEPQEYNFHLPVFLFRAGRDQ